MLLGRAALIVVIAGGCTRRAPSAVDDAAVASMPMAPLPSDGPPLERFVLDYRCDDQGAALVEHHLVVDAVKGTVTVTSGPTTKHGTPPPGDVAALGKLLASGELEAFARETPTSPTPAGEGTYCKLSLTSPRGARSMGWSGADAQRFTTRARATWQRLDATCAPISRAATESGPAP